MKGDGASGDLPFPEEQRTYVTCDFPYCKARRLTIDGRAVDQPAIAEAPASWTTHTWSEVNGRDYCPEHNMTTEPGEAAGRSRSLEKQEDAPEELDLAPDGTLAGDACAEEAADPPPDGDGAPDLDVDEDEPASAPILGINGVTGARYRPGVCAPTPPRRDPGSTVPGWIVVALTLIIIGVGWVAFMLWVDLDMAESRLATDTRSTFEDRGNIRELDCDRRGNVFRCSGEVAAQVQTQAPRPVRYTCDKDSCHFECDK